MDWAESMGKVAFSLSMGISEYFLVCLTGETIETISLNPSNMAIAVDDIKTKAKNER